MSAVEILKSETCKLERGKFLRVQFVVSEPMLCVKKAQVVDILDISLLEIETQGVFLAEEV